MARIDSLGEASSWLVPEKKKAGKKDKAQRRTFSELVESAAQAEGPSAEDLSQPEAGRRGIEELLEGVFSSGEALKKAPTTDTIRDYRRKVKAFVRYVVRNAVALEETTSGAGVLKRKRFTLVRVIDEKLEALAASVLAGQREQLSILAQIDQINGLLVDLVS